MQIIDVSEILKFSGHVENLCAISLDFETMNILLDCIPNIELISKTIVISLDKIQHIDIFGLKIIYESCRKIQDQNLCVACLIPDKKIRTIVESFHLNQYFFCANSQKELQIHFDSLLSI